MIDIAPNPCFRTTLREGESADKEYARVLERGVSYRRISAERFDVP